MKKIVPLLVTLFLLACTHTVNAQCYGTVNYDTSANAGSSGSPLSGNSTFNITTSYCNELIMIGYDGWNGPGSGPVTVNGNPATFVQSATNGNSGTADVYAYIAPTAGTYTIVCTESGYNSGYYNNFAAAFYVTGSSNPLTIASLTNAINTIACTTGGSIVANITTTIPGSMIYATTEINEGEVTAYPISYTGATFLGNTHTEDGIDAAHAYEPAPTAGTYTITSTNSSPPNNGCGGLAVVLVDIPPPLCGGGNMSVTSSKVSPSCVGNNGSITLTVTGGNTPYTYNWSPNVSTSANATGLSAGLYRVTVSSYSNSCPTYITDTIRLVGPSVSLRYTNAKCVPPNSGSAVITISNGKAPFTYLWSNGGTSQTDASLAPGQYYVTVTDSAGCRFKDSVVISTFPPPVISTIPASADSICYGSNIGITASGGSSYSWLPALGLSCSNCPSPTASPAVTTTYTVTGTDSNGCTNTATLRLKVIPLPRLTLTGRDTVCIGSGTTLNVTGANSYVWNPGAGTGSSYSVRPASTTTYTIKATTGTCSKDTTLTVTVVPIPRAHITASKDSVCSGDSLTLTGSGGTTYRWSPGNLTNAKLHVNPLNTVTYTLYTYGGACEDSATQLLKVVQPITAAIGATHDSICPHDTTTITATGIGGSATYKWNTGETTASITVSDTVTTTYTATVYGVCDSMKKMLTVNVIPIPKPVINGPLWRCKGKKDTLTVTTSNTPTHYIWSNGKTTTTIVTGIINADSTIYVRAINSLGCEFIDTFHIQEIPYPLANVTYPAGCGNGITTISAKIVDSAGMYTYKWNTGGTNDTIDINIIQDTVIYTVVISNGCPITKTITVIRDVPDLSACCSTNIFVGGNTPINAGGDNIVKYQWQPDNGTLNCDTCANVIASPTVTTTYTVTGIDAAGCPSERTVTIVVDIPCFDFVVPNVFTPTNGGTLGLDKVFYISNKNIDAWSILIFDRWGREVYKSNDKNAYWDGNTEGGQQAPSGVYYYMINATCQGTTFKKDGFVQLIR